MSIEGGGGKHLCFSFIMYRFCSIHPLYPASLSFTMFIFLLAPFNTWECHYFQSNLSLVWYAKVLLIKKEKGCNVVLWSSKHKQITFPHEFISYILRLSLRHIAKKMLSAVRGSEKKCKWGNGEMGKIVYGRRASQTCRYSLSLLKGCVRYIFSSLFCERQHFRNKEKWFLFHFESSFRSWNNQILTFSIFKIMTSSNAQAWNMKHILLKNWQVNAVW